MTSETVAEDKYSGRIFINFLASNATSQNSFGAYIRSVKKLHPETKVIDVTREDFDKSGNVINPAKFQALADAGPGVKIQILGHSAAGEDSISDSMLGKNTFSSKEVANIIKIAKNLAVLKKDITPGKAPKTLGTISVLACEGANSTYSGSPLSLRKETSFSEKLFEELYNKDENEVYPYQVKGSQGTVLISSKPSSSKTGKHKEHTKINMTRNGTRFGKGLLILGIFAFAVGVAVFFTMPGAFMAAVILASIGAGLLLSALCYFSFVYAMIVGKHNNTDAQTMFMPTAAENGKFLAQKMHPDQVEKPAFDPNQEKNASSSTDSQNENLSNSTASVEPSSQSVAAQDEPQARMDKSLNATEIEDGTEMANPATKFSTANAETNVAPSPTNSDLSRKSTSMILEAITTAPGTPSEATRAVTNVTETEMVNLARDKVDVAPSPNTTPSWTNLLSPALENVTPPEKETGSSLAL